MTGRGGQNDEDYLSLRVVGHPGIHDRGKGQGWVHPWLIRLPGVLLLSPAPITADRNK